MLAWVLSGGQSSGAFSVMDGIRQGCVLAPAMFSMLFATALLDAFLDGGDSVRLCFCSGGNLFGLGGLQA